MKALYKYPLVEYPYARLVEENRRRGRSEPEFEITDTGVFDEGRYVDVFAEYAKAAPDDVLIRLTLANRGADDAILHVLPTLWFRNTWSWGREGEAYWPRPSLREIAPGRVRTDHATLEPHVLAAAPGPDGRAPDLLFTENETNAARLFAFPNASPYVKDAFHEYVVHGRTDAVSPERSGTKAAVHYRLRLPARGEVVLSLRLTREEEATDAPFGPEFDRTFARRIVEADEFYAQASAVELTAEERPVVRQAAAGLLWSKQFYHYVVREWLEGDPAQPAPSAERRQGRNHDWPHLYNRDVISMPDKWEYPWYAAWDLAFHMVAFARIDPQFAKDQLVLFLREWYMHPNGQLPAYEFALGDANPPVHAWACWRVYKMSGPPGQRDRLFLARCFQKLLLTFTWWVNRKDEEGHNLFAGGFLGLDNIGVFDRSKPLPTGGHLEQADGTAWMAFYTATMLAMALELAREEVCYEDMASKFFEHFVAIADAMNTLGGTGLWDEQDGFYYDRLQADGVEIRCGCARWWAWCRCSPSRSSKTRSSSACPASRSGWTGSSRTARTSPAISPACRRATTTTATCIATACSPFPRVSAWCAWSATCSTSRSSSPPAGSDRSRATTARTPTCCAWAARSTASSTRPRSPRPASSAGTPTGGGRSGSR